VGIEVTYDVTVTASKMAQQTQYLDMLTHIQPDGQYLIEMYDKQKKLPLRPVKYIALDSNRPAANSYKLVVGQACRAMALCSSPQLAAKHVHKMILDMSDRGFNTHRLLEVLRSWALTNNIIPGQQYVATDMMECLCAMLATRKGS